MQSVSPDELTPVYCREQELSISVLWKSKRLAVVVPLIIIKVGYGTTTPLKSAPAVGNLDPLLIHSTLGPSKSSS